MSRVADAVGEHRGAHAGRQRETCVVAHTLRDDGIGGHVVLDRDLGTDGERAGDLGVGVTGYGPWVFALLDSDRGIGDREHGAGNLVGVIVSKNRTADHEGESKSEKEFFHRNSSLPFSWPISIG